MWDYFIHIQSHEQWIPKLIIHFAAEAVHGIRETIVNSVGKSVAGSNKEQQHWIVPLSCNALAHYRAEHAEVFRIYMKNRRNGKCEWK